MKIINIKLIAVCAVIVGLAAIAQAQINYRTNIIGGDNFVFNFDLAALTNKHCPNSDNLLTDAEIDDILRIHNETRQSVGTAPLKWNCDLAKFSQNWANADTFEHSTNEQREQIIKGGAAGENLAIDSDTTAAMSALHKGWINEKQGWDNKANTCSKEPCGHYTQMVWAKTQQIGCGVFRNSKKLGEQFPTASYFVCTYYPGGNVAGEKAY